MLQLTFSAIRRAFTGAHQGLPVPVENGPTFPAEELFERIKSHLDECGLVRDANVGTHVPWQSTAPALRLKAQAESIAVEIAALPGFGNNPILQQSHERLGRYWRSRWSSGGVSEVAYRVALKTVLVYLNQLPSRPLQCPESRDAARAA
jgi:hypothetical protein